MEFSRIGDAIHGAKLIAKATINTAVGVSASLVAIATLRLIPRVNKESDKIRSFCGILPDAHMTVLSIVRLNTFDDTRDLCGVITSLFIRNVNEPVNNYLTSGNFFNRHITYRAKLILFSPVSLICQVADSVLAIPAVPVSIICTAMSPEADLTHDVNRFALNQLTMIGCVFVFPVLALSAVVNRS